jgi:hypothetical protein
MSKPSHCNIQVCQNQDIVTYMSKLSHCSIHVCQNQVIVTYIYVKTESL